MRRLLTGYALWFNRTRRRQGHLFQNRFKSVLCQEDIYLLELVRYIHLNPIRAGIVRETGELSRYPYSGHSVLMGKVEKGWQDTDDVLGMFGKKTGQARRSYQEFVGNGIGQGRRKDITGGGLIRSAGGWEAVKAMRKDKVYQRSDERILGDGDFVGLVFSAAEEALTKSYALKACGFDLAKTALRVSEVLEIKPEAVWARGRFRQTVEARSLFCYWAVRELGVPMSLLGRKLGISIPSVSKSVIRGQAIADSKGLSLLSS